MIRIRPTVTYINHCIPGNRFEFRMVASSCNVAEPNTVLNAMMAEAFSDAADAIEAKLREGKHTDVAIRESDCRVYP